MQCFILLGRSPCQARKLERYYRGLISYLYYFGFLIIITVQYTPKLGPIYCEVGGLGTITGEMRETRQVFSTHWRLQSGPCGRENDLEAP